MSWHMVSGLNLGMNTRPPANFVTVFREKIRIVI